MWKEFFFAMQRNEAEVKNESKMNIGTAGLSISLLTLIN